MTGKGSYLLRTALALALAVAPLAGQAIGQSAPVADPIPARTEGVGPFNRVVLRNVTMIDGTGAPAQGPVDIVLVNDRIAEIRSIGAPKAIDPSARAAKGDYELDLAGYYVMPGFVDAHVHLHSLNDAQHVPSDYILKLWIANGVTSVREVGSSRPIEWLADIKARSARNEIVAPRIDIYPFFHKIRTTPVNDAAQARLAVQRGQEARGGRHQVHRRVRRRALRRDRGSQEDRHADHDAPRPAERGLCQCADHIGPWPQFDGALVRPARGDVHRQIGAGVADQLRQQ
jgi:hypothetical protein